MLHQYQSQHLVLGNAFVIGKIPQRLRRKVRDVTSLLKTEYSKTRFCRGFPMI